MRVHLDFPALRDDSQLAVLATPVPHSVLGKSLRHVLDQARRFDKNQTVVDGVSLENVTERTADNERDTGVLDGGGSLFTG